MTFQLTDDALDLEILKVLESEDKRMNEPQLATAIGQKSGGVSRVVFRCLDLQTRGLIFSVDQRFWKISISGKLMARKGVL